MHDQRSGRHSVSLARDLDHLPRRSETMFHTGACNCATLQWSEHDLVTSQHRRRKAFGNRMNEPSSFSCQVGILGAKAEGDEETAPDMLNRLGCGER